VSPNERPIFLVGFMGSGKTSVGRLVAGRLGWDFIDLDELVARSVGRSIEQIFLDSGEPAFRRAERAALETLESRQRCVVATGGGLFQEASNRRWLRTHGRAIWLDVPYLECVRRIGSGAGRPLWDPDADPEAFRALFERRQAAYALAAARVDASGPADEVAGELLRMLGLSFP
jgi:shikimate kinase